MILATELSRDGMSPIWFLNSSHAILVVPIMGRTDRRSGGIVGAQPDLRAGKEQTRLSGERKTKSE